LLTDRQTDKQTNKNRQKHYLLGGGNYTAAKTFAVMTYDKLNADHLNKCTQ